MNTQIPRFISPAEARRRFLANDGLLIVSVFPEFAHSKSHLEGSISREKLEELLPSLAKDVALAFY